MQPVLKTDTEVVVPALWRKSNQPSNWVISPRSSVTNCIDRNFGKVAVVSKIKFSSAKTTSFHLRVTMAGGSLANARVGVVAHDFTQDERKDADYSFFSSPGNKPLGQATEKFNLGVTLNGEVWMKGSARPTQNAEANVACSGETEIRIDITQGHIRVLAPELFEERTQKIRGFNGQLRLAVCAPQGFGFDLGIIKPTVDRTKDIPIGLDLSLNDTEMTRNAQLRTEELVTKIRRETESERLNIVVVGAAGSGKSCFINSLLSLFSNSVEERPRMSVLIGVDPNQHITRKVGEFRLIGTGIRLIDSIGIAFETSANHSQSLHINYAGGLLDDLLRGNIKEGFSLDALSMIRVVRLTQQAQSDGDEKANYIPDGFVESDFLTAETRNHGAFVVSAANSFTAQDDAFPMIRRFRSMNDSFPAVGIVTKLDLGRPDFKVRDIFEDREVGENFDEIRKMMQFHSFPMVNYGERDGNYQNVLYNLLAANALDALVTESLTWKAKLLDREDERQTTGMRATSG